MYQVCYLLRLEESSADIFADVELTGGVASHVNGLAVF